MLPLHSARLILRDFRPDDADAYLSVRRGARFAAHYPDEIMRPAFTRELLTRFLAEQAGVPRTRWQLAIVETATGKLIGSCGLRHEPDGCWSVGYELAEASWGQGYALEAMQTLLAVARSTMGVKWLRAECHPDNQPSLRLAQSLGLSRVDAPPESSSPQGPVILEWRA